MRNLSNPHGTAYAYARAEINFIVLVSPRIYESESVTTRVEIRTFLDRIFFCIPS